MYLKAELGYDFAREVHAPMRGPLLTRGGKGGV